MALKQDEYVLITAAYNEEEYIGGTIESVLGQTRRPVKWIIVSDGSTDLTDSIVRGYAAKYSFIIYLRKEKEKDTSGFISKVQAIQMGYAAVKGMPYRFIGILDGDVTFSPDYYNAILSYFDREPGLGIAGGVIYEQRAGRFQNRPFNTSASVAGAIQLFRRECYEEIGGHHFARYGGEDTICEIIARMKGWNVYALSECIVFHHKTGTMKRGAFSDAIRQGKMDYALGSPLFYEILRCVRRLRARPLLLGSLIRFTVFIWLSLQRQERDIPEHLVEFAQQEQRRRIKHFFYELF